MTLSMQTKTRDDVRIGDAVLMIDHKEFGRCASRPFRDLHDELKIVETAKRLDDRVKPLYIIRVKPKTNARRL